MMIRWWSSSGRKWWRKWGKWKIVWRFVMFWLIWRGFRWRRRWRVLVSELSQGPWKGKLIIFSDDPKLHLVGGEGLREKMEFVRGIKRGNHDKNVQKVFDVLLKVAVKGKLRGEEMVKRVFVFSDMGFGKSPFHYEDFKTDYQDIDRMFRENGYGDCVLEPEQLRSQVGQRLPVRQGDARDMEPGRGCTCQRIFQECDESVLGRKWGNFGS
ncbi:hypothetical protein ACS0TY_000300 [Phlomoides rotata]